MAVQGNPNQQQPVPPYVQDRSDWYLGIGSVIYLLIIAVACLILLIAGWPTAAEKTGEICTGLNAFVGELPSIKSKTGNSEALTKEIDAACAREVQRAFGWEILQKLSRDQMLLLIIAASGAIGGAAYDLRSSVWHLGVSGFKKSWFPWYVVQPFLGGALGVLTYLVVRAGFINPSSSDALNPFGFVAIAGLVGLFTENAFAHLRQVADSVLRKAEQEGDK